MPEKTNGKSFGLSTNYNKEGWNCGECLAGDYKAEEKMPDKDLGKSCKTGVTNEVKYFKDKDRSFGAPSVRTDIPKRKMKSVADPQN